MSINSLEEIVSDQRGYKIARTLRYYSIYIKEGITLACLSKETGIPIPAVEQILSCLEGLNLIQSEGSNFQTWRLNEENSCLTRINEAINKAELTLVAERAATNSIDVVGRLEWIQDTFVMIQHAKKDLQ